MRFEEIYGRFQRDRLSCEEAADLLGVSVSTFGRRRRRFDADGAEGLYDRRLGKVSARRAPADEAIACARVVRDPLPGSVSRKVANLADINCLMVR